jgi:hypothetical protein
LISPVALVPVVAAPPLLLLELLVLLSPHAATPIASARTAEAAMAARVPLRAVVITSLLPLIAGHPRAAKPVDAGDSPITTTYYECQQPG